MVDKYQIGCGGQQKIMTNSGRMNDQRATAPASNPAAIANQQIDNGIIHNSRSIAEQAISADNKTTEIKYNIHPPIKTQVSRDEDRN